MVDNLKEKADELEEARKETPTEDAKDDPGKGGQPQTSPFIDGANAAAERLEKANAKTEELITRYEEVSAKARLAGVEAGQVIKEETQEEKDAKQVTKMLETFS